MKNGWIKLHRKIENNPLWFLEPFTKGQAWVDLILGANHTDGVMEIRGNIIPIKRGQLGWSELTMMKRWKWSRNKVRRFLSYLSSKTIQQTIQQKLFNLTTITTILKYNTYQNDTTDDTTEGQQKVHKQQCKEIIKNEKKIEETSSPSQTMKDFILLKEKRNPVLEELFGTITEVIKGEAENFVSYWTEPTKSGKKQKWELEQTFELTRRLRTWFKNADKFNPPDKPACHKIS